MALEARQRRQMGPNAARVSAGMPEVDLGILNVYDSCALEGEEVFEIPIYSTYIRPIDSDSSLIAPLSPLLSGLQEK